MTNIQFITHTTPSIGYEDSVRIALAGGCKWIQLRMKDVPAEIVLDTARRVVPLCHAAGARLIIDDYAELLPITGADGVHLGRDDMPVDMARRKLGTHYIIGGTANTIDDIRRLWRQGADYIGCGPFRFTTTKKRLAPILGLEGYRDIVAQMRAEGIRLPIVAIGGITRNDIPDLLATGIDGIAVSGAVLNAPDPVEEMRLLLTYQQ